MKFLLFLILCTNTFSTENNKKAEKGNSEEFVRYHEMIHHINSLKNDPQDNIDENNFELENESK